MLLGLEPVPKPPVAGRVVLQMNRVARGIAWAPRAGPVGAVPAPAPGRTPVLRTQAQQQVWEALAEGPGSAAELADELGLSAHTVSAMLYRWLKDGVLDSHRVAGGARLGRPTRVFERKEG